MSITPPKSLPRKPENYKEVGSQKCIVDSFSIAFANTANYICNTSSICYINIDYSWHHSAYCSIGNRYLDVNKT